MGPLDALVHLLNLFLPALGLAALAALLAKWLWRRELAPVPWLKLAAPAAALGMLATLGGLIILGQDGRMATYAAMVVLCALSLWWQGFGPGR